MVEAVKADANGVGDNEMVMKGHAHYRSGLFFVTRYHNISAMVSPRRLSDYGQATPTVRDASRRHSSLHADRLRSN